MLSIGLASRAFSLADDILLYAEIADLDSAGLGSLDLGYDSDIEGLLGVIGLGSLDLSLLLVMLLEYERVTNTGSLVLSFKLEYDLVIGTGSFALSFAVRLLNVLEYVRVTGLGSRALSLTLVKVFVYDRITGLGSLALSLFVNLVYDEVDGDRP